MVGGGSVWLKAGKDAIEAATNKGKTAKRTSRARDEKVMVIEFNEIKSGLRNLKEDELRFDWGLTTK